MAIVNNVVPKAREKRCDDILSTGMRYIESGTEYYRHIGLQLISASRSSCGSCGRKSDCEPYVKAMEAFQAQSL
jgi:hypothetical protein